MPLSFTLMRRQLSSPTKEQQSTKKLKMTQEQSTPVVYTSEAWVTRPAPEFTLPAFHKNDMVDISLSSFKGKYLVLLFYPKDFTFVCPTEILAFNDRLAEFQAIGADVVAISCDHTDSHWAWANTTRANGGLGPDLQLPLLADKNLKVAKKYGILEENAGISLRGLFIISDKGILRSMTVNDFPVGRSVDETLRLIKAFQFTDTHGEVCPAGWDPKTNSKTMKDNQKDSKAYFQAVNK